MQVPVGVLEVIGIKKRMIFRRLATGFCEVGPDQILAPLWGLGRVTFLRARVGFLPFWSRFLGAFFASLGAVFLGFHSLSALG